MLNFIKQFASWLSRVWNKFHTYNIGRTYGSLVHQSSVGTTDIVATDFNPLHLIEIKIIPNHINQRHQHSYQNLEPRT